jgi:sensor histidine kinase YesM
MSETRGARAFAPAAGETSRIDAWWQKRQFQWAAIFFIWTVIGFYFTCQYYYSRLLSERPIAWREAASQQFIYPYLWAFGTFAVLWLAARFPVEGARRLRNLLLHALFATLFVIGISGTFHIINHFLNSPPGGKPYSPMVTLTWIVFNSSENYGIYALILLFAQAIRYYKRYREGELRASQLETQLSRAELQALKMQLQPHFLFNTLHSISALIHKDADAADRMIARLGDFLRLTLENSGAQEVTLQRELEFLKCYLEIERIRFQDRLTTRMDIDAASLDLRVPNLILQPIVENALRHGIAPRATPGRIEISAKRNNGTLRIEVQDDGPGLPKGAGGNGQNWKGVGLSNTRARLAQLYGAAHRFELVNAPEGGLIVVIEIPSRKQAA